jgi:flagellar biosynthesis protein FlhF
MKIRSYKGPALEPLYEAIRKELGPDAIVVTARTPEARGSLLRPLIGGREGYELIAVADDASSDRQLLDAAGAGPWRQLAQRQEQQWRDLAGAVGELRGELKTLAERRPGAAATPALDQVPGWARGWDPRFLERCQPRTLPGDPAAAAAELRARARALLRADADVLAGGRGPRFVVFAGPTGSGKTTTLAKLAARWCLDEKRKTALITTDTFRVAAVDQIKEYATLLGLELSVAFSASEAARAAAQFADRDVILVDTPGRNHYDQVGLAGIRATLQALGPVTVLLHLPAMLDPRHAAEVLTHFQVLKPNFLVLTKVDEVRSCDLATTLACESECPVAFVTDGQRVPQDLRPVTTDSLLERLVPNAPA